MTDRPVAVFDIDGTIFRSSLLVELMERLIDKGVFPQESRTLYEKERSQWIDRKGDYGAYIDKMVEVFGEQIKGIPYGVIADLGGEVVEEMRNHVYRYTRDLVQELKQKGYFILAISHSPKFIVDGFGYEHGFDKTYGTFYGTGPSGNFTGNIEDEELISNKAAVLQRAVRKEGLSLKGSVGVGDTESDIQLLEAVETAIAFNPNAKLYQHAKVRQWKIVVERKDVIYEF